MKSNLVHNPVSNNELVHLNHRVGIIISNTSTFVSLCTIDSSFPFVVSSFCQARIYYANEYVQRYSVTLSSVKEDILEMPTFTVFPWFNKKELKML